MQYNIQLDNIGIPNYFELCLVFVWWLSFGLLVTWMNDTAAYFVGSTIGRRKIWPRLSPKKTWEGTVSGWIGAAPMGGLVVWLTALPLSLGGGMFLGFCVGILGLMGFVVFLAFLFIRSRSDLRNPTVWFLIFFV